jgi:hypothetical protein
LSCFAAVLFCCSLFVAVEYIACLSYVQIWSCVKKTLRYVSWELTFRIKLPVFKHSESCCKLQVCSPHKTNTQNMWK